MFITFETFLNLYKIFLNILKNILCNYLIIIMNTIIILIYSIIKSPPIIPKSLYFRNDGRRLKGNVFFTLCVLSTLTYYTQQTFLERKRNLSDRLIDKVRTKLCTMFSLLTPSTILYILNDELNHTTSSV